MLGMILADILGILAEIQVLAGTVLVRLGRTHHAGEMTKWLIGIIYTQSVSLWFMVNDKIG